MCGCWKVCGIQGVVVLCWVVVAVVSVEDETSSSRYFIIANRTAACGANRNGKWQRKWILVDSITILHYDQRTKLLV